MALTAIRKWKAVAVVAIIWAVIAAYGLVWLMRTYDEPVVDIQAAYDVPELALPVFAQFVVTQKLVVPDPVLASRLVVPIYVPAHSGHLHVELVRNSNLLTSWDYQPQASEAVEFAELPINPLLLIDGDIQITFSAKHITHDNQARAPRLFIESSMSSYPEGGYFIAKNEKAGNVSLMLMGRQRNTDRLLKAWGEQPLDLLSKLLWIGLILLVASALPLVLLGNVHQYNT